MAKLGKTSRERDIFTEIDLRIMLINEQIKNHERSIEKAKRMSGWQGPAGVSGVDYSAEPGNSVHISFAEGLCIIQRDRERIERLKAERAELRRNIKRIKRIYESLGGKEGQVYYLRVIRKMTQEEAAAEMGFSKRHLQRMEAGMRGRGLM